MRSRVRATDSSSSGRQFAPDLIQDGADPLFEKDLAQRRDDDAAILRPRSMSRRSHLRSGSTNNSSAWSSIALAALGWNRSAGPPPQVVRVERHSLPRPHLVGRDAVDVHARRAPVRARAVARDSPALRSPGPVPSSAMITTFVKRPVAKRAAHDCRMRRPGTPPQPPPSRRRRGVRRNGKHERVAKLLGHSPRHVAGHLHVIGDGHGAAAGIDQSRLARRDGRLELRLPSGLPCRPDRGGVTVLRPQRSVGATQTSNRTAAVLHVVLPPQRGDDVFFGGHSGQTLPAVASIGTGPCSEKPGTTAAAAAGAAAAGGRRPSCTASRSSPRAR